MQWNSTEQATHPTHAPLGVDRIPPFRSFDEVRGLEHHGRDKRPKYP